MESSADRTSIPEVGGSLIDYFDPTNDDDAFAKIERAFTSGLQHTAGPYRFAKLGLSARQLFNDPVDLGPAPELPRALADQ